MKNINYENLNEITVKTQQELDMIPLDFKGHIYVEFGTYLNSAIVKNKYYSSVVARGNSSVVARENSSVIANANVQVVDFLQGAKIKINGNARIVYNPKNINEFMNFYGVKHNKKTAIFYKAVHKSDNCYFSDYDN